MHPTNTIFLQERGLHKGSCPLPKQVENIWVPAKNEESLSKEGLFTQHASLVYAFFGLSM